jgi:hypothetical protein
LGEPVIVLTGLMISALCFYAWRRLHQSPMNGPGARHYRLFFLLLGLSTLLGAFVGHCFLYCLPFEAKLPGWLLSMFSVWAMVQATLQRHRPESPSLSRLNIVLLAVGVCVVVGTLWFPVVEAYTALGFLGFVLPIAAQKWRAQRDTGSKHLLMGISFLLMAALSHVAHWSPSPWFCYFDIAHLWMLGAVWQFMLAAEAGRSACPANDVALKGQ